MKPVVRITYCTQCNWLLRSAWYAQELLGTFTDDLGEVALVPGRGGVFEIYLYGPPGPEGSVSGKRLWSRVEDGGFPSIKELKQRMRDAVAPGRDLGHVDT